VVDEAEKVVFGMPGVLLVWTKGQGRIPLACRLWKKGGPAKFELALEWLR
jgi:Transposase DDE domain